MNEFQAVSTEEQTKVEGGDWIGTIINVALPIAGGALASAAVHALAEAVNHAQKQ